MHLNGLAENGTIVEAKHLSSKYIVNVIASCAFGVEANAFSTEKKSKFFENSNNIFATSKWKGVLLLLSINFPRLIKMFKLP